MQQISTPQFKLLLGVKWCPRDSYKLPNLQSPSMSIITLPGCASSCHDGICAPLQVTADPPAAEFPGCGKRTNLTATVPSATVSGSITFDLTNPRLEGLPIEQYATRQLGVATLFGGTGVHTLQCDMVYILQPLGFALICFCRVKDDPDVDQEHLGVRMAMREGSIVTMHLPCHIEGCPTQRC